MIRDSRESIQAQVEAAKLQLTSEAGEMARSIASNILGRSTMGADSS
jgi:F0F1-type ATP synthase membrane subunit b/b'